MRHAVHLVSFPHGYLDRSFEFDAFGMKTYRLPRMLKMGDIPCITYGPDIVDEYVTSQCLEYVPVFTEKDRINWLGSEVWDRDKVFDRWDIEDIIWKESNHKVAEEIRKRWEPGDYLGHFGGRAQEQISIELQDLQVPVVELGIGYSGVLQNSHKIWESRAWRNYIHGKYFDDNIVYYNDVIGNMYDTNDFLPRYDVNTSGMYLLFVGRPIARKGLQILQEIVNRVDIPVKIAGQPGHNIRGAEYVGRVSGKAKAKLFAGALSVLSPSTYLEPFCGVNVESLHSGTPVITHDWGAAPEYIINGINGYLCSTLHEWMMAIEKVPNLNRRTIAYNAQVNFSLETGAMLYKQYFDKLNTLFQDGWYQL